MGLIDTHTHLESFARKGLLAETLARARDAGVAAMITIGTDPDDWSLYQSIAAEREGFVHYTAGLHPCSVGAGWEEAIEQLEAYWDAAPPGSLPSAAADASFHAGPPLGSSEPGATPPPGRLRPIGLGECGLDRFHLPKSPDEAEKIFSWQRGAFAAQLAIAKRLGCPVVVHSRGAFHECIEVVDASGVDWSKVVFHCFTDGPAEMAELTRRGGVGSFTGILTYKSAGAVRAAAEAQGLDRFMLETDAPYLTPMPHRGKPNEPAYVAHTAEFAAAEVFRVGLDELAATTTANARRFFGI